MQPFSNTVQCTAHHSCIICNSIHIYIDAEASTHPHTHTSIRSVWPDCAHPVRHASIRADMHSHARAAHALAYCHHGVHASNRACALAHTRSEHDTDIHVCGCTERLVHEYRKQAQCIHAWYQVCMHIRICLCRQPCAQRCIPSHHYSYFRWVTHAHIQSERRPDMLIMMNTVVCIQPDIHTSHRAVGRAGGRAGWQMGGPAGGQPVAGRPAGRSTDQPIYRLQVSRQVCRPAGKSVSHSISNPDSKSASHSVRHAALRACTPQTIPTQWEVC